MASILPIDPGGSQFLSAATTDATSNVFLLPRGAKGNWVFSADISGSGTVSATVTFEGSIDGTNWYTIGTAVSLSGTTTANGSGAAANVPWPQIRAVISSITGTGAAVDAWAAAA